MFPLINDMRWSGPHFESLMTPYASPGVEWEEEVEFLGNVSRCSKGQSFEEVTSKTTLTVAWSDIWWYCNGYLLEVLPIKRSETYILVQLTIPSILAFQNPKPSLRGNKHEILLLLEGHSTLMFI
jgi:hypothetical protein